MRSLKIFSVLIFILFFTLLFSFTVSAEGQSLSLSLSHFQGTLTDGRENASATVTRPLVITSDVPMDFLYLVYYDTPTSFHISQGEEEVEVEAEFLRQYVDLTALFGEGKSQITLTFSQNVRLMEIYAFAGPVPSWVQIWEEPCQRADLCLMTTHADDEQLFFAGILPLYAGQRDLAVQVVYFTDHVNEPLRRHELLNGLWTVGVENYPVISSFPDLYSTSLAQAQQQLAARGYAWEDIVAFQVEMIRRFRPLVVIGHDPNGEYGHGQHRLNCATLQEAVTLAGKTESYPESAEQYGAWQVPKTYLHLYPENEILMDWDQPLEYFGGKTAFQATQMGFFCHKSQQYTWFRGWLNGKNGEISKADQITTHSPCRYGLYLSTVGEDVEKNDFFEHLKTYEEQYLEEQARLRAEKTAEHLSFLGEEERESSREAARLLAQYRREADERSARVLAENRRNALIIAVPTVALLIFLALFVMRKFHHGKKRRRR